ncbi:MAG: MarR family transcriptional regulator [Eubacteriales bacterium]|nr:MarR family transcriptional regulator [Eubacteriales bacterium]
MDKSIARMITLLARKSQGYIGHALSKYNLSSAEQPFFMALQHYEGVTQEDLTALVCVDKAATARAVKSLEEKGFLVRLQDTQDRRQNRIYPTDAAKQLADAVHRELLHFNDLLTEGIEPSTLELVYHALQKMDSNFPSIAEKKSRTGKRGGL